MKQITIKNTSLIILPTNEEKVIKNKAKSKGERIKAVADFETTHWLKDNPNFTINREVIIEQEEINLEERTEEEEYKIEELAGSVYCWNIEFENGNSHQGDTIEEFFQLIGNFPKKNRYFIYFHNLKWDGEFILIYLIKNHVEEYKKHWNFLKVGYQGFLYIKWKNITFLDSFKFLQAGVKKLTKNPERLRRKETFNYEYIRPKNYQPTREDRELCKDDCLTVLEYIVNFPQNRKIFPLVSIASYSFYNYKQQETEFKKLFPNINLEFLRDFYRGGFTECWNEYHVENQRITYIDINSLYPFIMENQVLPYGQPSRIKTKKFSYGFYTLNIKEVKIKQPFIPFITVSKYRIARNEFGEEVLKKSGEETPHIIKNQKIFLVEPIYNLFLKFYSGSYNFVRRESYFFQNKVIFKDYITELKKEKLEAEKTGHNELRHIAKIAQNSLYGKFAQKFEREQFVLKGAKSKERKNTVLYLGKNKCYYKLVREKTNAKSFSYLPVASAITAESKAYLVKHIQQLPKKVLYHDTDSLIIKGNYPQEWNHPTNYGAWKQEKGELENGEPTGNFNRYHVRASKCYLVENSQSGERILKHKGINKPSIQERITFKQFSTDEDLFVYSQQAQKIEGGIYLRKIKKVIRKTADNPKKQGINSLTKKWNIY